MPCVCALCSKAASFGTQEDLRCLFCWQGSGMIVFSATHPLGPWHRQPDDLGCIANASNPTPAEQGTLPLTAEYSPGQARALVVLAGVSVCNVCSRSKFRSANRGLGQGCNYQGAIAASASRAQQNFVLPILTSGGSTEYIWTGDRWMQVRAPLSWLRLCLCH
jgi:hypothetical protein